MTPQGRRSGYSLLTHDTFGGSDVIRYSPRDLFDYVGLTWDPGERVCTDWVLVPPVALSGTSKRCVVTSVDYAVPEPELQVLYQIIVP